MAGGVVKAEIQMPIWQGLVSFCQVISVLL